MFFGFSHAETNAFIILIPVLLTALLSEPVYRWWVRRNPPDFQREQAKLDSLVAHLKWIKPDSVREPIRKEAEKRMITLRRFDPNTVQESELKELGLSPFLSARVVRFREKGGKFRKKEDLLKIYGMDSAWYKQAEAYITLAVTEPKRETKLPVAPKPVILLDINTADSVQLLAVYGIGPALSKRIRTFRDRLGGFVAMEQLNEVYGLDTAVVTSLKKKFIIQQDFIPLKININAATAEELIRHPYFKRNQAQAILTYRRQHGNYQTIDDLGKIQILTDVWITKMKPYLMFE